MPKCLTSGVREWYLCIVIRKTIQLITQKTYNMENKNILGKIINIVITVLTAIATTFGITSCMGAQ